MYVKHLYSLILNWAIGWNLIKMKSQNSKFQDSVNMNCIFNLLTFNYSFFIANELCEVHHSFFSLLMK